MSVWGAYSHRERTNVHGVYDLSLLLLVFNVPVLFVPKREQYAPFACVPYLDHALLASGVESELPRARRCSREVFVRS